MTVRYIVFIISIAITLAAKNNEVNDHYLDSRQQMKDDAEIFKQWKSDNKGSLDIVKCTAEGSGSHHSVGLQHISAWFVLVFVPICLVVGLIAVFGVTLFAREDVKLNVALRKAHQNEVDDLVKETNQKYNDMLAQRMDEEDKMRATLLKDFETKTTQMMKKHQKEMTALRTRSIEEKNDAVTECRSKAEEEMSTMKMGLVSKMEGLLIDLESVRKSENVLKNENRTLQDQINSLEEKLRKRNEELRTATASLDRIKSSTGASTREMEEVR